MNDKTIINIGKSFFWISFLLGNICFFGYLITKQIGFAVFGYILLVVASLVNLLAIIGLMIYGSFYKEQLNVCLKSAIIILINIPLAVIYAAIGINIIDI